MNQLWIVVSLVLILVYIVFACFNDWWHFQVHTSQSIRVENSFTVILITRVESLNKTVWSEVDWVPVGELRDMACKRLEEARGVMLLVKATEAFQDSIENALGEPCQ